MLVESAGKETIFQHLIIKTDIFAICSVQDTSHFSQTCLPEDQLPGFPGKIVHVNGFFLFQAILFEHTQCAGFQAQDLIVLTGLMKPDTAGCHVDLYTVLIRVGPDTE